MHDVARNLPRTLGNSRSAVLANGSCPATPFIEELNSPDTAKVKVLLQRFADVGEIKNREKFRKIADDLWEFKSFQIRLFCFIRKRQVIITHGVKKKRDDLNPEDIERAKRIRRDFDAQAQAATSTGKKK